MLAALSITAQQAAAHAAAFAPCPRVDADSLSPDELWALQSAHPKPMVLRDGLTADYIAEFGKPIGGKGEIFFEGAGLRLGGSYGYTLTAPGYAPGMGWSTMSDRFPMPAALRSLDLRPVISIGNNGTGERDIAHHYHPATAMRLLQGRKIWALRPPDDPECDQATGTCTDPFDVCAFYARAGAPPPACVQEAGDTILVPDGWYHGTCNNASWTVGWGGQGRRLSLSPPSCHHCRLAGQLAYAFLDDAVFAESDAAAMLAAARKRHAGSGHNMLYLGRSAQAPYMAIRSAFNQFIDQTALQQEMNKEIRSPDCTLVYPAEGGDARARRQLSEELGRMRSTEHVHVLVALDGGASLRLRHRGSGEAETRVVRRLTAALWMGDALDDGPSVAGVEGEGATVWVSCRVLAALPPDELVW